MSHRRRAAADTTAAALPAELLARIARLRRLRYVSDGVLAEIVAAEGLPVRQPDPAGEGGAAAPLGGTDRELAARLCAGCPVHDECLELDLRWMADQTVGVFAGLTQDDRRLLHAVWAAERFPGGTVVDPGCRGSCSTTYPTGGRSSSCP